MKHIDQQKTSPRKPSISANKTDRVDSAPTQHKKGMSEALKNLGLLTCLYLVIILPVKPDS